MTFDSLSILGLGNGAIVDDFKPNPSAGSDSFGDSTGFFNTLIDWMSYISIPIAVVVIVLVGIYMMGNIASNNSGGAAANLRKVIWVLGALVLILNAANIVKMVIDAADGDSELAEDADG